MRSKSATMLSICATRRRFSSTWNFLRRMSVSRDFIDLYSPEAPTYTRDAAGPTWRYKPGPSPGQLWQHNVSFRFPHGR